MNEASLDPLLQIILVLLLFKNNEVSISSTLMTRCDSMCELCGNNGDLNECIVTPRSGHSDADLVALCSVCEDGLQQQSKDLDVDHWRCLNDSIWNPNPSVQVVAYRMLQKLSTLDWAQDLISMMYMDDATREWAEEGQDVVIHKDSNGHILKSGDSVVLIKDLNVKGAGFTAKRGTAVRRISLVHDNAEHIQGRINDQTIIILTKFVKKSS